MTKAALLFSTRGRIGRQTYWLTGLMLFAILVVVVGAAAGVVAATVTSDANGHITSFPPAAIAAVIAGSLVYLLGMWVSLMLGIKRCHDRDRTGWILLLFMVPVANSWLLVELLFISGTRGPNQYGPDPIIHWVPPAVSNPSVSQPATQSPLAGPS